jgi:transposase
VVAAPAPDHAIARGRAGVGLLAQIVVSKFDDHCVSWNTPTKGGVEAA